LIAISVAVVIFFSRNICNFELLDFGCQTVRIVYEILVQIFSFIFYLEIFQNSVLTQWFPIIRAAAEFDS